MITYHKGDVLLAPQDLIAHGCNCAGGFGAGVALAIARKYPQVKQAYLKKFHSEGWKPGDIQQVLIGPNQAILNLGTQKHYLPRGVDLFEYEAFKSICKRLKQHCLDHKKTLAMPKIGSALAGGDWKRILLIIETELADVEVHIYEL